MEKQERMDPLAVLLRPELPDMRRKLPEAEVEVTRLSELAGAPVIFRLRGLTYGKVRDLQERDGKDRPLYIVLEGCVEPDWKNPDLLDPARGIATPLDAMRARLLPGEIEDLSMRVQELTGYLRRTIADVKNA